MVMWVGLNFYLAERLSNIVDIIPDAENSYDTTQTITNSQHKAVVDAIPHFQQHIKHYSFDRKLAEDALAQYGRDVIYQSLRAYIEKKLNDTVPDTIDKGNLDEKKPKVEVGRPGKWYVPLPLREGSPEDVSSMCFECYIVIIYLIKSLTKCTSHSFECLNMDNVLNLAMICLQSYP